MGLFLACCLLITAIQLVTDPITCDVKAALSEIGALCSFFASPVSCPAMLRRGRPGSLGWDLQRLLLDARHLHPAVPAAGRQGGHRDTAGGRHPGPGQTGGAAGWVTRITGTIAPGGRGVPQFLPVGRDGAVRPGLHLLHRSLRVEVQRGEAGGAPGVRRYCSVLYYTALHCSTAVVSPVASEDTRAKHCTAIAQFFHHNHRRNTVYGARWERDNGLA